MVNYPHSSSVAVTQARKHLDNILRFYNAGNDSTKLEIAKQFQHFAYQDALTLDAHRYPSTRDSAATKCRAEIATLSRHMHNQTDDNRTAIAGQCRAAVGSVGGVITPLVGMTDTNNPPPALGADGKFTLDLKVQQPTLSNVLFVNWSIDGAPLAGISGNVIKVAPKETATLVWAEVHSMSGQNIAISWQIPAGA